jgi:hypothetical protein
MRTHLPLLLFLSVLGCDDGGQGAGVASPAVSSLWQKLQCSVTTCKVPAKLDFKLPSAIYSSDDEVRISPSIQNPTGELITDVPVKFDVEPKTVGVITQNGSFRCVKTGEAVVFASSGPAVHSERVLCQLVGRIKAPKELRLILSPEPIDPEVEAFDTDGKILSNLTPQFDVKDSAVVTVENGKLIPRQVGITAVKARAGAKHAIILVEVRRKVKSEPLLLSDGHRLNITLGRGNYEAEIKVRSGNSSYGVTLKWVGGRGCQDHYESQEISSRCTIDTTGAMIIENPTTFGFGPSADGYLAIYEVP